MTAKINILNLINFEEVNKLLEGFNQSTGFVTAILDLNGNVLSKSGWRQICTQFHRINPETSKNCTVSDTVLANELENGEKYHFYQCLNGLVDVAVPIIINGEHIANLFSGQFFFEEPNRAFFKKQAEKYGFNQQEYIKALEKVPVVSKEKVKLAMDFLLNMTQLISHITYQKLEQTQLNDALKKSEERFRSAFDQMLEGCQIIGHDWRYIYLNHSAEIHNRRPNKELLGNRYQDMWPGIEKTEVYQIIKSVLETRLTDQFESKFVFHDGSIGWFNLSIQPVPEGVFILSIEITNRKQKEIQLFESEFRFNKLYENSAFGMVLTNEKFQFLKTNPAFCSIMGYDEAELLRMTFKDLSLPEEIIDNIANIQKLIRKEISVYRMEKRYIRKDGRVIWGSLTVVANFADDGSFLYNLATVEDITRRKQAEDDIKILNERISTATSASGIGIWDWDIQNNILNWDDQMYALFGLKRDQFTVAYEAWLHGLHPDDREFSQNETQQAILGKKEYDTEFRVVWPDRTTRFIKAKGEVFRDEMNIPVRMVGINFDITDLIEIEIELKKSEERFRDIIFSSADWVWEVNKDGKYTYSSQKSMDFFEMSEESIIGKTPFDLMPEEEAKRVAAIFAEIADKKEPIKDLENWNIGKDGELICLLTNGQPVLDDEGELIGYRGIDKNITERKRFEQELIKAKEKAEESDRLKSAFLANMSHEIRTPMNGILGFAGLLKEPELSGEQQQEYIQIIEKSGARMLNIINDIVSISKIESGIIDTHLSETNINHKLQFVYDSLKLDARSKNLNLFFVCGLTDDDAIITTDVEKLYGILTNLVKNAIKYTDKGTIEFGYKSNGESIELYVKDTGIGIPKERQEAIFERFIQADIVDKMARQGAGLGLSISKAYVEMLGGRIWVESKENMGSTFYFTLPRRNGHIKEIDNSVSIKTEQNRAKNLIILITDDDETSNQLMAISVKDFAKDIIKANTGKEAIEVCKTNKDLDLVLMDIQMPDINGYEATRQIREFNKDVIIIAQTAFALPGDREKSIEAGCNDYISKPIKKDELELLIQKHFENYKSSITTGL